jgi:hypothetical protein
MTKPLRLLIGDSTLPTIAWAICWIAIVIAGFWPFQFHIPNDVRWLPEEGLSFGANGIAYSPQSLCTVLGKADMAAHPAFSIELLLRARGQNVPHVGYIISAEDARNKNRFALLQYDTILILQLDHPDRPPKKLGITENAISAGKPVHVVIVNEPNRIHLYVNGVHDVTNGDSLTCEQLSGPLVLGNSAGAEYPWQGELLGLAIYGYARSPSEILGDASDRQTKPVTYTFRQHIDEWTYPATVGPPLRVPSDLVILRRTVLAGGVGHGLGALLDISENVLGFVPFGFFGAVLLARRWRGCVSVFAVCGIGAAVSLAIEFTQAYMPLRDSSAIDWITNVIGTAVGTLLFLWARKTVKRHRNAPDGLPAPRKTVKRRGNPKLYP